MRGERARGIAAILAAFLIWSTWGVFLRRLDMAPHLATFYLGVPACGAAALLWFYRQWRRGRPLLAGALPPPHAKVLFAIGAIFLVNNLFFLAAIRWTTLANAVFAHATAPVLVALFAPLLLHEARVKVLPLALALSLAGLALLMPGVGVAAEPAHVYGIAAGLASALAYSALVLLARRYSPRISAPVMVFYMNLVVCLGVAPWVVAGPFPTAGQWAMVGVLGVSHATGAALLYLWGVRRVRAQAASVMGYVEPLGAVVWGMVFLAEMPMVSAFAGGALICLGGWLVVREETRVDAGTIRR